MTKPMVSVPELGPLLGRFSSPAPRGPEVFPLDDLRRKLLGLLYQQGGAARRELAAGRAEAARAQLAHATWLSLWQDAVRATGDRLLGEIDRRFELAGTESHFPPRRLALSRPSDEDRRVIRARLDAAGIPLERVSPPEQASDWTDGLLRIAMALDASWERLERVVTEELAAWQRDVERVRVWRRPTGPLWAATIATLILAVLLGLSVGGYLPAPGPLRLLQQWFWTISWR